MEVVSRAKIKGEEDVPVGRMAGRRLRGERSVLGLIHKWSTVLGWCRMELKSPG